MTTRARESRHEADDPVASDPALRFSGVQARAERSLSAPPVVAEESLALVSIGSPANLDLLEPTYAYVSAYSFACLPAQIAQRLNVAVYELYANGLRYGTNSGEVRLEITRTATGARVRVVNRAEPQHIERLRAQISKVRQDPAAAFTGEMNRFAGASQPPPMLGVVRVAHESSLELELVLSGDRVEISTHCEG